MQDGFPNPEDYLPMVDTDPEYLLFPEKKLPKKKEPEQKVQEDSNMQVAVI